ncbi:MAG: coenzyme F420 hydrogenase, partial [Gammaproteobacteria bacterium]
AQTQAAGLRQRREGLAYRLARRRGLRPRKRVVPDRRVPSAQRRLVYRMRCAISAGSHRAFRIARRLGIPAFYIGWARVAAATYHALAYHRGRLGAWIRRVGLR